MYLIPFAILLLPSLQSPTWSEELPALDRSSVEARSANHGGHLDYLSESPERRIDLRIVRGAAWGPDLDLAWKLLPGHATIFSGTGIEGLRPVSVVTVGLHRVDIIHRFESGKRPRGSLDVYLFDDEAMARRTFREAGKGAAAIVTRAPYPGLTIGDECQVTDGSPERVIEYRVGRLFCHVFGMPSPQANVRAARAVEFRAYAAGISGNPYAEAALSGGKRLPGLRIRGETFISLKALEPYVDSQAPAPPAAEPGVVLARGAKLVRVRAYTESLNANGASKPCRAAIPYKDDLWVPAKPVIEALGL